MPSEDAPRRRGEPADCELAAAAEALRADCRRLAGLTARLRTGDDERLEGGCLRHLAEARDLRERISRQADRLLRARRDGRLRGAAQRRALQEAGRQMARAAAGYGHVCRRLEELIEAVSRELTTVDRGRRALQSYGRAGKMSA